MLKVKKKRRIICVSSKDHIDPKIKVQTYSNQAITSSLVGIVISSFNFLRMPPMSL